MFLYVCVFLWRLCTKLCEALFLKSTSPLLSFGKHRDSACQVSASFVFIIQTKLGVQAVWAVITIHPEGERMRGGGRGGKDLVAPQALLSTEEKLFLWNKTFICVSVLCGICRVRAQRARWRKKNVCIPGNPSKAFQLVYTLNPGNNPPSQMSCSLPKLSLSSPSVCLVFTYDLAPCKLHGMVALKYTRAYK